MLLLTTSLDEGMTMVPYLIHCLDSQAENVATYGSNRSNFTCSFIIPLGDGDRWHYLYIKTPFRWACRELGTGNNNTSGADLVSFTPFPLTYLIWYSSMTCILQTGQLDQQCDSLYPRSLWKNNTSLGAEGIFLIYETTKGMYRDIIVLIDINICHRMMMPNC